VTLLLDVIKACAILAAAGILGNWFLKEVRAGKQQGLPWHAAYLSPPGLLIIGMVCVLPVLVWWFS
jgi:hypothetical protein